MSEPPSGQPSQPPRIPTSGGPGTREDPLAKGRLDWAGLVGNRFILGGVGVVVVLFLTAIVLVAVGGSGDDDVGRSVASGTEVSGESTRNSVSGLSGEVRTTTTMRNGPGATYAILGTIPSGAVVSIVGRNADEAWLQVTYPAGSQLRGWVPAAALNVSGDVSRLAIAGPGESPAVFVPTGQAPIIVDPGPFGTAALPTDPPPTAPIVTPAGTEAPTALPSVGPSATATTGPTKPPPPLTPEPVTPTEKPVTTPTPPVKDEGREGRILRHQTVRAGGQ